MSNLLITGTVDEQKRNEIFVKDYDFRSEKFKLLYKIGFDKLRDNEKKIFENEKKWLTANYWRWIELTQPNTKNMALNSFKK